MSSVVVQLKRLALLFFPVKPLIGYSNPMVQFLDSSGAAAEGAVAASPRRRGNGLVNEVVQAIAGRIGDGSYRPGNKLPTESQIMRQFDVSRTVVREALSKLQAAGAVETRHGIGTFVLPKQAGAGLATLPGETATLNDILALLELRICLEAESASLAAQRRSEQQLSAIAAALHAFQQAIDSNSDAIASDFEFHNAIARATGNPHYASLMEYLGTAVIPRSRVNSALHAKEDRQAYLQRVNLEHESILQAIRHRDADSARAAMRMHLSNSRDRLHRGLLESESKAHKT
jgi:GntR family transcriptional regulator, transcriptional repressor for pyruvate dehydrogenase complex